MHKILEYMQNNRDNIVMKKFDYSFLDSGLLPARFVNLSADISSLKTLSIIRKEEYIGVFTELESIAKIQSIKSSNEIEGIITSDERIKEIVNNSSAPLNHNEKEIAGYRDALNIIHNNYKDLDFRVSDILKLHGIMTVDNGGKFKDVDNYIMETDRYGNRKIRFKPLSAKETPEAMRQLELAYLEARSNSNINQLLLIPCVILDFLCIHPFRDGNGRMSRLLSLLLLYKNNYDIGKYVSFEEMINKQKYFYYESLKESSYKWEVNKHSYFPFIENFLGTLMMCYRELDKRFSQVSIKKKTKKQRIEETVLNSLVPLSKKDICNLLPDISPTTIEAVLGSMVKDKKIVKHNKGKSTTYSQRSTPPS